MASRYQYKIQVTVTLTLGLRFQQGTHRQTDVQTNCSEILTPQSFPLHYTSTFVNECALLGRTLVEVPKKPLSKIAFEIWPIVQFVGNLWTLAWITMVSFQYFIDTKILGLKKFGAISQGYLIDSLPRTLRLLFRSLRSFTLLASHSHSQSLCSLRIRASILYLTRN